MFDPSPFNPIVYYAHLLVGSLGLAGALLALFASKGSRPHKLGGRLFIGGAVVAAISALIFVSTRFGVPPIVNAITALVGLATAVLALRSGTTIIRYTEYALCAVLIITLMWFANAVIPAIQSGRLASPIFPLTVVFVTLVFVIGDIRFFLRPAHRAKMAVQRHLSRMLWTFAIAIRAPLFELRDDWGLPTPAVLIGPLVVIAVLIGIFWRRAGRLRPAYA